MKRKCKSLFKMGAAPNLVLPSGQVDWHLKAFELVTFTFERHDLAIHLTALDQNTSVKEIKQNHIQTGSAIS